MLRFLLIVGLLVAYTGFALARMWPEAGDAAYLVSLALFALMLGSQMLYRARPQVFDSWGYQLLSWTGSIAMGFWGTFFLVSLPILLVNLFVGELMSRGLLLSVAGITATFVVLGFVETLRGPRVKELLLPVEELPSALRDFRIVQLSDLHVGPTIGRRYVQDVVARTNDLSPDLIVVTGDLADARPAEIAKHLAPLATLRAKYGVYYVTGNHEYYWDARGLVAKASDLGFIPLINESRVLDVGGAKLFIAGVTDPMGTLLPPEHLPDLAKALQGSQEADFRILLAHRPGVCVEAERLGADLQFSGHTHAGQFFPFSLLIPFAHKYYRGLNRHGRMWVYINPGTGYWGPPNRFGVPAEITFVKLALA